MNDHLNKVFTHLLNLQMKKVNLRVGGATKKVAVDIVDGSKGNLYEQTRNHNPSRISRASLPRT